VAKKIGIVIVVALVMAAVYLIVSWTGIEGQ
jgi:hypothetical protein